MYAAVSVIIGEKGRLNAKEAKLRARKLAKMIHTAVAPVTAMELSIFGYDDDERELWDITEVRDYIITFAAILNRHGVTNDRFIPNTQFVINACHAVRNGQPVLITGTEEDAVREGVEQILEHQRKSKRFVN